MEAPLGLRPTGLTATDGKALTFRTLTFAGRASFLFARFLPGIFVYPTERSDLDITLENLPDLFLSYGCPPMSFLRFRQ